MRAKGIEDGDGGRFERQYVTPRISSDTEGFVGG